MHITTMTALTKTVSKYRCVATRDKHEDLTVIQALSLIASTDATQADVSTIMSKTTSYRASLAANGPKHAEPRAIKSSLPCVTFSGTNPLQRNRETLETNGIIIADIDHLDAKTPGFLEGALPKLQKDPRVISYWKSVSGQGLAIMFAYETTTYETVADRNKHHLQAFTAMERILLGYELEADPACKDTTRLRILGHDPELYLTADPEVELLQISQEDRDACEPQKKQSKPTAKITEIDSKNLPETTKDYGAETEYSVSLFDRMAAKELIKLTDFSADRYGTLASFTSALAVVFKDDMDAAEQIIVDIYPLLSTTSTPIDDYIKRLRDFAHDVPDETAQFGTFHHTAVSRGACKKACAEILKNLERNKDDAIKTNTLEDCKNVTVPLETLVNHTYSHTAGFLVPEKELVKFHVRPEKTLRRHLVQKRVPAAGVDTLLMRIEEQNTVDGFGQLVGHEVGKVTFDNGTSYLVTSGRSDTYAPKEGSWDNIRALVESLLGNEPEQITFLYGWLSKYMKDLTKINHDGVGQLIVFLGERGLGKSCLARIIENLTGYTQSSPIPWMSGATTFNGEFAKTSLFLIEDASKSRELSARTVSKKSVDLLFSGAIPINPKHMPGYTARFTKRIIMTTNSDEGSVDLIPRIEDMGADKISMLYCVMATHPYDSATNKAEVDAVQYNNAIYDAETAAFHHFLLNYEIAEENRNPRTGVNSFFHEQSVSTAVDNDPRAPLVEEIRDAISSSPEHTLLASSTEMLRYINNEWDRNTLGYQTSAALGRVMTSLLGSSLLTSMNVSLEKQRGKTGIRYLATFIDSSTEEAPISTPKRVVAVDTNRYK